MPSGVQADINQEMLIIKIIGGFFRALADAWRAVLVGLSAFKNSPQILIYPYLSAVFIIATFPIVNGVVLGIWSQFDQADLTSVAEGAPPAVKAIFGLVTFSVFYTIFVAAFFTSAISAEVTANLGGRSGTSLRGLRLVLGRFWKVAKFALLAIFFFPLALVAQRQQLKQIKKIPSIFGRSLSVNMAQLAPVILTQDKSVMATIRQSVDTLGRAWAPNLVIKVCTWIVFFTVIFMGFLPGWLENAWFDSDTAHLVGIITGVLLALVGYVITKVIGSVFTATLYHQAVVSKEHGIQSFEDKD